MNVPQRSILLHCFLPCCLPRPCPCPRPRPIPIPILIIIPVLSLVLSSRPPTDTIAPLVPRFSTTTTANSPPSMTVAPSTTNPIPSFHTQFNASSIGTSSFDTSTRGSVGRQPPYALFSLLYSLCRISFGLLCSSATYVSRCCVLR